MILRSIIEQLTTLSIFGAILGSIWVVTYRLFFHPLAKIPGPLLARASFAYAYWYNAHGGRFYLQVQKLHEQYGPIVRITPNEIHLSDPENCDKIYFVGSRYGKDPAFYGAFGTHNATFTTPDHDTHRVKRSALNPFFSRKKVLDLEGIVQQKAQKLVERMKKAFESTGRIDLHHGFRAISVDVITDYSFDNCYNFLDEEDFGVGFFDMIRDFGPAFWLFQLAPAVQAVALRTPFWLAKLISAPLTRTMLHHETSRRQILRVKYAVDRGEKVSRTTIFHNLLRPDATEGYVVPTVEELKDEAYILVAAAADTAGNALTIAAYNVVRNREIYARLSAELKKAFNCCDQGGTSKRSLQAVANRTRLSFGVPGRLPRVVPECGAQFHGYQVPPGTVVSMSAWTMHHNEDLFPDAEKFNPDRWTDKSLDRFLFSFGKGSRQCVGMPLAYCELYVTLGRVFREFDDLKTALKSREELLYDDYFSGYHPEKYNKFVFERA